MVLPWAVRVARPGKEIVEVVVEEAHSRSSVYPINNFRMEGGFGTWAEAEAARLQLNPTRLKAVVKTPRTSRSLTSGLTSHAPDGAGESRSATGGA
jgi:hypothetical protein